MSQRDESENDIWEYKPLQKKKKKKTEKSQSAATTTRRCTSRRESSGPPVRTPQRAETVQTDGRAGSSTRVNVDSVETLPVSSVLSPACETVQTDRAAERQSSGHFCPMCQMPFSVLVVQSQRWHVAECLDSPRDKCKECPDGLRCSSTIPNHYKKFNHTLLAHSRASSDSSLLSLSQQAETSGETSLSHLPWLMNNDVDGSDFETSQDSAVGVSASSPHNSNTATPLSKRTNGLLFLRSPGPEDLKKKKGWSSSTKGHKSISASQESKTEISSTPVKEDSAGQACEVLPNSEPPSEDNDAISYSPRSEFPPETKINNSDCRKSLFKSDAFENDDEDSLPLFSDSFSSEDELLTQFIGSMETNNVAEDSLSSSNIQLESVTSLAVSTGEEEAHGKAANAISPCTSVQSPQSVVLERLRETLLTSDSLNFKDSKEGVQSEQPHANSHQELPSETSTVQGSKTMSLQRGQSQAGQASALKQTDIGVFFGLKPLKVKEKEVESGPSQLSTASNPALGENWGQRQPRRVWEKKSKADPTTNASQGTATGESSGAASAQGEARRGWRGGWGRRKRTNADGEVEYPRCPFYKKIPGTKFVIDAFQYGEIEGITAYFLTHFHSDHYGGLTKNSTVPIYCNRITGNLVKSKLRVAEQYVHILPMNTQVTVEGVKVILLEANHCPGSAMLLFFLHDGQKVLHTGDFRADPSMETYPELLSCRVQTLYLDTTYCSPEYTFPRQQEVINFAVNTAFELVTLSPRTLVVCGSYSVGKEKVFLALADVLGSKVCLSRDKYNTMCCLESEQIRQRITTDWKAAQVHVLPMMQISFDKLQQHLARFSQQYDQLLAFKPTGWTFSQKVESVEDIRPQITGNISIYGIPYSEHSSFLELKRFVQWIKPLKIIPTVNNGSWASRKAMEKCFSEWLMEAKAKL
ncbi:DNA cross-link repair 1A protein [Hippoglossus stenolepis]|uniref:DNA cross-link repair 1A protein n=1 Tax=Hippoglossus stenolepis TaxID=195615 RepID=UPI001FAFC598|nr:DNA cross-link repair 1A protein [Hippoglossus stenolepis]